MAKEILCNDVELQRMVDESAVDEHHQRPVRELTIRHFLKIFATRIRAQHIDVGNKELFRVFLDDMHTEITVERLRKVLAGIGMTVNRECAQAMMEVTDIGHDDTLDFYEFNQIVRIIQSRSKSMGSSMSGAGT